MCKLAIQGSIIALRIVNSDLQALKKNLKSSWMYTNPYATPENVKIGDDVSLTCSLPDGGEASLQWMTSDGNFVGPRQTTNRINSLVYNFTATTEFSFERFTCVSRYPSGANIPTCSVTPLKHTFVTIAPLVSRVKEGDNVTFTCNARLDLAEPHLYSYTWIQGLQGKDVVSKVPDQNGSSYTISNLQLSEDEIKVKCKANYSGVIMESEEAVIHVSMITFCILWKTKWYILY